MVSLSDKEESNIREFAETTGFVGFAAPPKFMPYLYRDTKEVSA
jgi:hypothetical protein